MAVISRTSTVCDVCRNPNRRIRTYRIQVGEESYILTVCREHSLPLIELLKVAAPVPAPRRPGPPVKLWEMGEIEDAKRSKLDGTSKK